MKKYRSFQTPAFVLKRSNFGEKDRIVTLYTAQKGKISAVAKGCRDMRSSRLSSLEPGNLITAFLLETKGLPILAEVKLTNSHQAARSSLKRIKYLMQMLEVMDQLAVEEESQEVFDHFSIVMTQLSDHQISLPQIKSDLTRLISLLGFPDLSQTKYTSVHEYVSFLADRPFNSYQYLTVGER